MSSDTRRIGWGTSTLAALVAACATTTQPASAPSVGVSSSVASSSPTTSEPTCPEEQSFQPGEGCVYDAEGHPPEGKGAAMRPIPVGTVGEGEDASFVHSFWVDERAVSVEDYEVCLRAGKCPACGTEAGCTLNQQGGQQAINCVSFHAAKAYCEFVGKRLVTDVEWDRFVARRDAYGVRLGEPSEWIDTFFCSDRIGGCGHAKVLRNVNGNPEGRHRGYASLSSSWIGFRCAWSTREPPKAEAPAAQVPISSTTPGAITCGIAMCNTATEACCEHVLDGVGQCIAKQDMGCPGDGERLQCDENADCPSGKVCCPFWGCSGGCLREQVCQAAPCDYGPEVCLPGGTCRAGFSCVTEPDGRHGHCVWQNVGASCGGKRCSGDKPVCCWDPKTNRGTCSASSCSMESQRLECTGPRDCGGSVCGHATYYGDPNQPDPGYGCLPMSHIVDAFLCHKKSDCPVHPPTGSNPKGCRHTPDLPPGVKACDYGIDEENP